jgi:hypothetical protein
MDNHLPLAVVKPNPEVQLLPQDTHFIEPQVDIPRAKEPGFILLYKVNLSTSIPLL